MKAIVYKAAKTIAVEEVSIPEVKEGWALIKISHVGICGGDLNIYAGTHPRATAPLIMGHEFSGHLVKGHPTLKEGTLVTVYPLLSCGHCEPCTTGNPHVCNTLRLLGIDIDGGMAEYVLAPVDTIVPIPEGVSEKLGAFIEPLAVAVHAIRDSEFLPGDNAVVYGCGPIGLVVGITLRYFGASNVTMVETNEFRAEKAREMGFEVLNPAKEDVAKIIYERTNNTGADWVFDCAGHPTVANAVFDVVKVRGNLVMVAAYKKPPELPMFKGMAKELAMNFVRVYTAKDYKIAAELIAKDENFEKIITHVLPIEEAQKGFDLLTTPNTDALKVMYKFD
jgi:(R,R)-butanediol dehydrogenase / meso-butanediol dehydrogenase / diacetyl reductase